MSGDAACVWYRRTRCRDGSEFYPDPGVEPRFSTKLSDFRGSGYDRGHMVRQLRWGRDRRAVAVASPPPNAWR